MNEDVKNYCFYSFSSWCWCSIYRGDCELRSSL